MTLTTNFRTSIAAIVLTVLTSATFVAAAVGPAQAVAHQTPELTRPIA